MGYEIREFLDGQMIAEHTSDAPTFFTAVQQTTGSSAMLHRSGDYLLEVRDLSSGRTTILQYADLPH